MSALPCAAYLLLGAPLAALLVGFFGLHRRAPRLTHWPILLSCAVVTGCAWWLAWAVYEGRSWDANLFQWVVSGNVSVEFGLRIDGVSAAVLAMVTLVGALIHVYAVGYMREDPGFSRFFLYFHLFLFSMLGLLLSNNYLQLYLFWEGVGLSSYLLIGFWFDRESARRAALKAFLVNRVGDACFLLALLLLLGAAGSVRFVDLFARLSSVPDGVQAVAALLLFAGAAAKSAQFPLYLWLPDAMEGPTPTSALMHAATMVTAGVFLMVRSWPLLARFPEVLTVIAVLGALTALGAAVVASMKKDLKRILAYSTVSHLGLMMLAVGCGDVFAATTHLVTHGFFKAALFLCAGNVLHALGKSSATVDEAGGLWRGLPFTGACFAAAALALAGMPPFAGFFSKDLILEAAFHRGLPMRALALAVAAGSAFYISRMFFLTFFGDRPEQTGRSARPHEGDAWLQVPVGLLAAGSAAVGLFLVPTGTLHRLVHAAPLWAAAPAAAPHFSWTIAGLGLAAAGAGLAASYLLFLARPSWDWDWRRRHPALEAWLDSDLGWQPFVQAAVVRPVAALADFTAWTLDLRLWDRFVESTADALVGLGEGLSGLSRGLLNEYLWWLAAGVACLLFTLPWAS